MVKVSRSHVLGGEWVDSPVNDAVARLLRTPAVVFELLTERLDPVGRIVAPKEKRGMEWQAELVTQIPRTPFGSIDWTGIAVKCDNHPDVLKRIDGMRAGRRRRERAARRRVLRTKHGRR